MDQEGLLFGPEFPQNWAGVSAELWGFMGVYGGLCRIMGSFRRIMRVSVEIEWVIVFLNCGDKWGEVEEFGAEIYKK